MSKLKPVPENLDITTMIFTGANHRNMSIVEKINEQNKYLDYLRKEIQDLKDMKHG